MTGKSALVAARSMSSVMAELIARLLASGRLLTRLRAGEELAAVPIRQYLRRQFVAVGRGGDLERVDHAGQHAEIAGEGGQLDEPLRPVPLLQPIEHRLVDPITAHQLARIGDDVALVFAERGG